MQVSCSFKAFGRIEHSYLLSGRSIVADVKHGVYRVNDAAKIMKWGHNIGPVLNSMLLIHLFVDFVEVNAEPVDCEMDSPKVSHEKLCSQNEVR